MPEKICPLMSKPENIQGDIYPVIHCLRERCQFWWLCSLGDNADMVELIKAITILFKPTLKIEK